MVLRTVHPLSDGAYAASIAAASAGRIIVVVVAITASDFIREGTAGSWGVPAVGDSLDEERLQALIARPDPAHNDIDVSLALMDLVRDELEKSGTKGDHLLSDPEMRTAIRALQRVSARAGYEFKLPFFDHGGWRSYGSARVQAVGGRVAEICSATSSMRPTLG